MKQIDQGGKSLLALVPVWLQIIRCENAMENMMCSINTEQLVGRSRKGGFDRVENTAADALTVWGFNDGEAFRRTFPSARAWRAWRNLQRAEIEVRGMQSGDVR